MKKTSNFEAKFLARKVRKPVNRKPLYQDSKKKSTGNSPTLQGNIEAPST